MTIPMPVCQVALSTMDLIRTQFWYARTFGFVPAGEKRFREGATFAEVPGLPDAAFTVWCLVDRQEFFQLELFEFVRPRMRALPEDWRPSDIGYSMMGLYVADFDATLDRIARFGGRTLTAPMGRRGERRVCLRDPDGILVEVLEEDLRPRGGPPPASRNLPVAVRSITLSVPSLDAARRFWCDAVGLTEARVPLHHDDHQALWGLAGARKTSLVLSGGDVFVELVQYVEPRGRPRPAGYLLSDQGVLNVALGSTNKDDFDATYERLTRAGFRSNRSPWTLADVATVAYMNDDQGFSVELLHVEPTALVRMGFLPLEPTVRE